MVQFCPNDQFQQNAKVTVVFQIEVRNKIFFVCGHAAVTYRSLHHPISQPGHEPSGCNHGGVGSNTDYTSQHGKLDYESE